MTKPLDPTQPTEKKIIVDEDWKNQVEREKTAAENRSVERDEPPEVKKNSGSSDVPLPSPSLSYLATSLYYQAMIALGLMPHPVSGKAEIHLPQAKHAIDMLDVLQQKTEGNRTPVESAEIEGMLHQLRLTYLQANK